MMKIKCICGYTAYSEEDFLDHKWTMEHLEDYFPHYETMRSYDLKDRRK